MLTEQHDATGRITAFNATAATPTLMRTQTFTFDANGNRTSDTISTAGTAPLSYSHTVPSNTNRQTTFAGINVLTNAAGDITSLAGRTMAYDSAGRLHQATHTPACPSGSNCLGLQTTTSHHNGHGQRFLRTTPQGQSVYLYGTDQYTLLSETHQTSALTTSSPEHIYLPTASGPMPVIAIIDGQRFAVHSDHLNTPRRLTDASNRPRWQWAYSAFGDLPAQSLATAGLSTVSYALRYPGQVDDGNGLFYNFNRFYDPRVGRYTSADPIGLEGGWNRFGYVDGNPLEYVDPLGLKAEPGDTSLRLPTHNCSCTEKCLNASHGEAYEACAVPSGWFGRITRIPGAAIPATYMCRKIYVQRTCERMCMDFCSGKGECPPAFRD